MKFVFILMSSLLISTLAYASPLDSLRSEQREEGLFVVHEVEEEETIYSIAKRYGGSVTGIIQHNQIVDNRIEIGQIIHVLIEEELPEEVQSVKNTSVISVDDIHVVSLGETLYSISKKYDLKLKELRKWNNLPDNSIAPGMQLKLNKKAVIPKTKDEMVESDSSELAYIAGSKSDTISMEEDPFAGYEKYLVQTGETLSTIGRKIDISIDSLKFWNDLKSDYLKIGQELFFKSSDETSSTSINTPKRKTRTQIDENGFERIYEEGVASVIESMSTSRFLALHRTLPIGTNLEVRNLMNNQIVHVKIVGKLPNTGLNKNLLLRLSQPAYDQLGILDSKSRVEVSHNKL